MKTTPSFSISIDSKKLTATLVRDLTRRIENDAEMALTIGVDVNRLEVLSETIFEEFNSQYCNLPDKFHKKWTSFKSNLMDSKNKTFIRKILSGSIRPCELPIMNSDDMMDETIRRERLREEKAKLRRIKEASKEHNRFVWEHKKAINEKLGLLSSGVVDEDEENVQEDESAERRVSLSSSVSSKNDDDDEGEKLVKDLNVTMENVNPVELQDECGRQMSEVDQEEICPKSLVDSISDVLPILHLRPEDLLAYPHSEQQQDSNTIKKVSCLTKIKRRFYFF